MPEVEPEILASVARNLCAPAPRQHEVHQLAHLEHVGLPADSLRRHFVAFQKYRVPPVDQLEAVVFPVPEQVLRVHVVVDDVQRMGFRQQIQQRVDDRQHFQLRDSLAPLSQFAHQVSDDHALGALHHNVLVHRPADRELPAAEQCRQHRVPRQPRKRLPLVQDAHFLPGANRRRILRRRAFDHNRTVIVLCIHSAQGLAGASPWVDVVVAVAVIE